MEGQGSSSNSFLDTSHCNNGSDANNLRLVRLDDCHSMDRVGQSSSGMNSPDAVPQNINFNIAYEGDGSGIGQDAEGSSSLHAFQPSGSGPSPDAQHLSGKRKEPEETSAEVPGRDLSSTQQAENSDWQASPIPGNAESIHREVPLRRSPANQQDPVQASTATMRNVLAASTGDPTAILSLFRQGVLMTTAERQSDVVPPILHWIRPQVATEMRAMMVSEIFHILGLLRRVNSLQHEDGMYEDMHGNLKRRMIYMKICVLI